MELRSIMLVSHFTTPLVRSRPVRPMRVPSMKKAVQLTSLTKSFQPKTPMPGSIMMPTPTMATTMILKKLNQVPRIQQMSIAAMITQTRISSLPIFSGISSLLR